MREDLERSRAKIAHYPVELFDKEVLHGQCANLEASN